MGIYNRCESIVDSQKIFLDFARKIGKKRRRALRLFTRMIEAQEKEDQFTYSVTFCACASLEDWKAGIQIHSSMIKSGIDKDSAGMPSYFLRRCRERKLRSAITSVSALFACSNTGLVGNGMSYFSLLSNYGIEPCIRHYTCVVRLLGCAGRFNEAVGFINKIPFEASVVVLRSLLGACVVHHIIEVGYLFLKVCLRWIP
ncbi:hypothetical protein C5167_006666 [Papaver somniferum]|uniref:Pentacotripeptide-repeat region of PRORP domain-containing protein n=1 Tax=Papaver somniferum TaxID=3469 RepID=A0A4Y7JH46_PAPSO|nr:hypothetical protein C5167_006666 [Papaver somniferum]